MKIEILNLFKQLDSCNRIAYYYYSNFSRPSFAGLVSMLVISQSLQ